jgi:hypothetical protein
MIFATHSREWHKLHDVAFSLTKINLGLKGQSSDILIMFFDIQYIDRTRPECEPLLLLKIFRGPHDFRSKNIFFTRFRRNPFGKIIFLGKVL